MIEDLKNLTIVIPSIGDQKIIKLLKSFENFNKKNFNILIIIPFDKNINLDKIKLKIDIIKSNITGQVYQRYLGFKNSKTKYTMQLDDDCFINETSIIKLISTLKNKKNNFCVGPVFFDIDTNKPIHAFNKNLKFLIKSFIISVLCHVSFGINRMGKLSKINTNYGVDPNFMKEDTLEVEWMPGGCILHKTENLLLENYFPFSGKAYCEDIMHSILLTKKNINLIVVKDAECYTEFPIFPKERKNILKYYKAMEYCGKISNTQSFIRFNIWKILSNFRYLFTK